MNRPKRKKSKDNPYTLLIINNKYYVEFKDEVDFFEIPETYMLEEWKENEKAEFKLEIEFKEEVKEIAEIKKINNIIKNTKIFYDIP